MAEPLRALVDLTALEPGGASGGMAVAARELVAALRGLGVQWSFATNDETHHAVATGWATSSETVVCCAERQPGQLQPSRLRLPREHLAPGQLPRLARDLAVEVTWCPMGWSPATRAGVPSLVTVVDLLHLDHPPTLKPPEQADRAAQVRLALDEATLIHAISHWTARRLQVALGAPPERLRVARLALPQRLAQLTAAGAPPREPFFFYPANDWHHKNHQRLLEAYRMYRSRATGEAWKLVLCGHRSNPETWGPEAGVLHLGHIPDDAVMDALRRAGALVFPSLHEGFGLPLLEAMAAGCPILAHEGTSLPELAGDSAACWFDGTNPGAIASALLEIAAQPERRHTLAQAGAHRLSELQSYRDAACFAQLLRETAGTTARTRAPGPRLDFPAPSADRQRALLLLLARHPGAELHDRLERLEHGGLGNRFRLALPSAWSSDRRTRLLAGPGVVWVPGSAADGFAQWCAAALIHSTAGWLLAVEPDELAFPGGPDRLLDAACGTAGAAAVVGSWTRLTELDGLPGEGRPAESAPEHALVPSAAVLWERSCALGHARAEPDVPVGLAARWLARRRVQGAPAAVHLPEGAEHVAGQRPLDAWSRLARRRLHAEIEAWSAPLTPADGSCLARLEAVAWSEPRPFAHPIVL